MKHGNNKTKISVSIAMDIWFKLALLQISGSTLNSCHLEDILNSQ